MNRLEKFNKYFDMILDDKNESLKYKYFIDENNWLQIVFVYNSQNIKYGLYLLHNGYEIKIDCIKILQNDMQLKLAVIEEIKNLPLYKSLWREQQINSILED